MTRLVGRVTTGHLAPLSPRAQHPEDAVPQGARVCRRSAGSVFSLRFALGEEGLDEVPLLVGQVHFRSRPIPLTGCRARPKNRPDFGGLPRPIPRSALLNLACARAFSYVWIENGMGFIIPGFVPSTLHEVVEYVPPLTEWKVTAGSWSFGLMVLTVAVKVTLPVLIGQLAASHAEHG